MGYLYTRIQENELQKQEDFLTSHTRKFKTMFVALLPENLKFFLTGRCGTTSGIRLPMQKGSVSLTYYLGNSVDHLPKNDFQSAFTYIPGDNKHFKSITVYSQISEMFVEMCNKTNYVKRIKMVPLIKFCFSGKTMYCSVILVLLQ